LVRINHTKEYEIHRQENISDKGQEQVEELSDVLREWVFR